MWKLFKRKYRDVPKKRIPRAEFYGIILNFVECGKFGTAHISKWKARISS